MNESHRSRACFSIYVCVSVCMNMCVYMCLFFSVFCVLLLLYNLGICCLLTAEVLQDEVQLPAGLEGIDQVHDEWVLHLLQDVPLSFGVSRVLGIPDNHCLFTMGKINRVDFHQRGA